MKHFYGLISALLLLLSVAAFLFFDTFTAMLFALWAIIISIWAFKDQCTPKR